MLQMLHYKKDIMLEKTEDNKNKMLKALEEYYGIVTTSCQSVGISRITHYRWLEEDEDYKSKVQDIKNAAIDFVESKLLIILSSE